MLAITNGRLVYHARRDAAAGCRSGQRFAATVLSLLLIVGAGLCFTSQTAYAARRPNIVVFLADDMDYWLWRDFAIGAKTLLNCKEKRGSVSSPPAFGLRGIDGNPV